MSQGPAIRATKLQNASGALVTRDVPVPVVQDLTQNLSVLNDILRELTTIRLILAQASSINVSLD